MIIKILIYIYIYIKYNLSFFYTSRKDELYTIFIYINNNNFYQKRFDKI